LCDGLVQDESVAGHHGSVDESLARDILIYALKTTIEDCDGFLERGHEALTKGMLDQICAHVFTIG
jgi:hypothetical protein